MNIDKALEDARTSWVKAGADSDIGLWWIADDVRQLKPDASEEEIRRETLRALQPLLSQGLLRAVNLLPGGAYHPWEGSVDEQLARIDSEWARLGRAPDLGDIVWFIGPESQERGRPSSR
ncbi:hypothetical protein [Vitiosangium sp. GDMCC 1.1324]|uniref:hypothetical protein n=1 Tax=Vitiosangium sp. (strain GDMCC 1.1324) TaxID=2138576 RepID=UPI000D3CEBB8|nr:hypothetical protein [Vitiosangium sp. GDMCC 1.1324]PTL82180.1 hypothetical protein DAT35_20540 [Vitiosangium sp. GDMCC 1.1324]